MLVNVFLFLGLLSCTAPAIGDDVSVQQVLDAWRSREQRIESASFSYTVKRTDTAQSIQLPGESPLPSADTTYSMSMRLSFDGSSIRLERAGETWDLDKGVLTPSHGIYLLHDGSVSQHTLRPSDTDQGFLSKGGPEDMTLTVADVWPIAGFVRPSLISRRLAALHGIPNEKARPGEGDDAGLLLISPREGVEYWVDPEKDFALVRVRSGARFMEFDYIHEFEEWVPRQWSEVRFFSDGELMWRHDCTVDTFSINTALPEEEFQVKFAEGTHVMVDQGNGTIRSFISDNRGELIPPDLYRPSSQVSRWSWLLLGALAIGLIAALFFLARRQFFRMA